MTTGLHSNKSTHHFTNTMKHHWYLQILCFLNFSDSIKKPDVKNKNYDRLWKLRAFSDIPNGLFVTFYDLWKQDVTENFKV